MAVNRWEGHRNDVVQSIYSKVCAACRSRPAPADSSNGDDRMNETAE